MCCLSNNRNNLDLNMYAPVERPERKLTYVYTIEYDVKLYHGRTAILNGTYL